MLAPCGSSEVAVRQVRVGVKRHGGDFVAALERRAVQRFDIRQHLVDLDAAGRHLAAGQAIEHERVVGIGTVSDGNTHIDVCGVPGRKAASGLLDCAMLGCGDARAQPELGRAARYHGPSDGGRDREPRHSTDTTYVLTPHLRPEAMAARDAPARGHHRALAGVSSSSRGSAFPSSNRSRCPCSRSSSSPRGQRSTISAPR